MKKIKTNQGFSLIEMIVALALLSIILLALFKLISFTSTEVAATTAEDIVQSACIELVETTRATLQSTKKLQCGTFSRQDSLGSLSFTIFYEIKELQYPGAYSLAVSVRTTSKQVFKNEVVLYA